MRLRLEDCAHGEAWGKAGIALPAYNAEKMAADTRARPLWAHFGAGNIFRAFIAACAHDLLNQGRMDRGVIAVEAFDHEIIDQIYAPHDNLALKVTLNPTGQIDGEVIASVAEALKAGPSASEAERERLARVFEGASLQLVSFTITEKGYALTDSDGRFLPAVAADIQSGPSNPAHIIGVVAALLRRRFLAGAAPLAVVSMDNCAHNGEKLRGAVLAMARGWQGGGFVDAAFIDYLSNPRKISFPWSMIDKITPGPSPIVQKELAARGLEGADPIVTAKNTAIAAFVNAERTQYLVVEDDFPNGRPPLEHAGVYMADRATVERAERVKVTACLNPLHTALSVYAALLGIAYVNDAVKDPDIHALIARLGYGEGLPVVDDPGIFSPRAFLDEVLTERLPNPFLPDTPQRINMDISQKMPVRFGETIKAYHARNLDMAGLAAIPMAIAGWLRYLLGVDDAGNPLAVSQDPMRAELQAQLQTVVWDDPASAGDALTPILRNAALFGMDLTQTPLAAKINRAFAAMLGGKGAVRKLLTEFRNQYQS